MYTHLNFKCHVKMCELFGGVLAKVIECIVSIGVSDELVNYINSSWPFL